jgi:hypothetical protein
VVRPPLVMDVSGNLLGIEVSDQEIAGLDRKTAVVVAVGPASASTGGSTRWTWCADARYRRRQPCQTAPRRQIGRMPPEEPTVRSGGAALPGPPPASAPTRSPHPEGIGPYRITRVLGQGGWGQG